MTTFGESLYGGTLRCYKIIATEADLPSAGGNIDASSINIDNKWEIRLDASSNFILENTAISINSIIGDAHSGKITLYDYNLEDLENVTITDLSNGQILKYNSTASTWENVTDPSGVETLNNLTDVTITDLSNGQILKYNSTTSVWENVTDPSGVETLNDLTDVTITNAGNGQILQYNDSNEAWENATLPTGVETLNDLTDVTITNAGNGQILQYNDSNEAWENATLPTGVETLNDLTDVTITNLANGQILKYNSTTSTWENVIDPSGVETLNDLTDVTITNAGNGQILQYNDSNEVWENATLPTGVETLNDLTDVTITNLANGQILKYNSTTSVWENVTDPSGVETLNNLTDVTITNVGNGQILKYNSTISVWENVTDPSGVETLNDLTDVTITNAGNGQILIYNDTNEVWENATLPTGVETLNDLTDVTITNAGNGQILIYNDTNEVWENNTPTYLDGANLEDNFLIKSVNNQAVSTHLFNTSTTTTNQLEFNIPVNALFNVLSGVIETTTNALGTIRRMNLATSYIANTRGITITESGRVGIGILDPEEDLEVDGSIQIDSAGAARLKFQQSGQNPHALAEIDAEQDGTNGGDLQFYTKLDGGNVTEKLRINNIGAVGIGGANYGTSNQVMVSNGSNNPVSWENQRFYEGQPFNYYAGGGADGVARADFTNNTAVAFHGTTYGSSKFLDILYSGVGIEIGSYDPAASGSTWRVNYQILQLTGGGNWAVYDWISGTTTVLVPPSDDRVKTHEEIFNGETYINYIKQIVPKKYKRYNFVLTEEEEQILEAGGDPFKDRKTGDAVIDSEFNPKIEYGVIAQDIHKISGLEDIVTVGTDERPWRVDYRSIDTITLGAVKGLIERIETLEARLALLEAQRVN